MRKAKKPKGQQPSPQEKGGVLQKIGAAYNRLPILPFLDRATSAILYASVLFYMIFTAFVFLAAPSPQPQLSLVETALAKNAQLMLLPGESYVYDVQSEQGNLKIYYDVSASSSCQGEVVAESSQAGRSERCILPGGNLAAEGYASINSGLGNQSILLFSPWMLAVSENFSWQVKTVISAGSVQVELPLEFKSAGKKTVAGREAFEILMQAKGDLPTKIYVDSEKRVALLFEMGNTTAKLVQAPFALDCGNSTG